MTPVLDAGSVTEDAVLGGRLRLLQPTDGHRVGHDAILLAAACPAVSGERLVELGAGVGAAGLAALAVDPGDELTVLRELPGIPPRVLAIARHRDRYHSRAADAFVEEARAVCAGLSRAPRLAAVGE